MLAALALILASTPSLKVGVTMHPLYSWTAAVTRGLPIEVRAVLPPDVDVGAYQPRPADVKNLEDLDALVVNGIGHDDFIDGMLKASGNAKCVVIKPNDGTALLKNRRGDGVNSHTFLSLTNAIQQTYAIARALSRLKPEWTTTLNANAAVYTKRLRAMRTRALEQLAPLKARRVITVHDGYSYLLQELGVELVDVVEPAHGLVPSAVELQRVVTTLKAQHVRVVLSEERFPTPLLDVLKESGAKVTVISHIATGAFTLERFETDMQSNLDALVAALSAP